MASRTTATAVREIMQTGLLTPQINAFIADANLWVTEELAPEGLTADRLEVIERYLACALCRLRELGLTSAAVGDVTESYQVDPQITDYMMRAASFDSTGKVRQQFLAPRPVAAPTPLLYGALARVGKGFKCDS